MNEALPCLPLIEWPLQTCDEGRGRHPTTKTHVFISNCLTSRLIFRANIYTPAILVTVDNPRSCRTIGRGRLGLAFCPHFCPESIVPVLDIVIVFVA
jgi:hypothetical protein